MGNRANIQIKYSEGSDIFFYSHWDGKNVDGVVQLGLIRGKDRWNDESYLARIIFCAMVEHNVTEEIGYGISPYEIEEGSPKCIVDIPNKTVEDCRGKVWDFEEFSSRKINAI